MKSDKRYALITGASSGIGYELAKHIAIEGYNLLLIGRSQDCLVVIKNQFESDYLIKVSILALDLSDLDNLSPIKNIIEEENLVIDVLINCAGFGMYGQFSELDWENELSMINVNLIALSFITKIVLKQMTKRGSGKILNVASTASFKPGPLMAVYFASKAYVLSFSEAIAAEVKHLGITVTTLCPGATKTNFQKRADIDDSQHFKFKRMMNASEVARIGINAMNKRKNIVIPGFMNKFLTMSLKFLPQFIIAQLMLNIKKKKR